MAAGAGGGRKKCFSRIAGDPVQATEHTERSTRVPWVSFVARAQPGVAFRVRSGIPGYELSRP